MAIEQTNHDRMENEKMLRDNPLEMNWISIHFFKKIIRISKLVN